MKKDVGWKTFFEDNHRYADVINGIGFKGKQLVKAEDLLEQDSSSKGKARDLLKKTAFGVNFALIGIENQETVDYKFPLRNLHYEVNLYEKQAAEIQKELKRYKEGNRGNEKALSAGEYLYGFRKENRLKPVVTFVLYSGKEPWDGPMCLHDILDFNDIPKEIRKLTENYKINLVDIRRIDTSVFRTDVKYVFDFLRCAENKQALYELVNNEPYYKEMDEDAYEVVRLYAGAKELVEPKNYDGEGGKRNMCQAIRDLMEDSKQEGIETGIKEGKLECVRNLIGVLSDEVIAERLEVSLEVVKEIHAAMITE